MRWLLLCTLVNLAPLSVWMHLILNGKRLITLKTGNLSADMLSISDYILRKLTQYQTLTVLFLNRHELSILFSI